MEIEYSAGIVVYAYRNGIRHYLFLKREKFLDFPKGHLEKGESSESAAIRETEEEAGIKVEIDPFFRHVIDYWFVEKKKKIRKYVTYFIARAKNESVKVSKEHLGYEWLTYEGAFELKLFKNQKELLEKAASYIERKEKMDELNKEYGNIYKNYREWNLSRRFVAGEGPLNARVMFVGQAPGRNEDIEARPFVGISGKLLDKLLRIAGLNRKKVYITSVVQFFPPDNRQPTDDEIEICKKFLFEQIEIIRPRIVVLLGSTATRVVANSGEIMKRHGSTVDNKDHLLFLTLHPASGVRLKKLLPLLENDFKKLRDIIREDGHKKL